MAYWFIVKVEIRENSHAKHKDSHSDIDNNCVEKGPFLFLCEKSYKKIILDSKLFDTPYGMLIFIKEYVNEYDMVNETGFDFIYQILMKNNLIDKNINENDRAKRCCSKITTILSVKLKKSIQIQ